MTTLVVLPGLDGTATLLAAFSNAVRPLFESVMVIPYPTQQPLGYPALETLVRAALPSSAPFVLLGESFSGPIALAIAAEPPAHLVAVILSTSFGSSPLPRLSPLAGLSRFAPVRSLPRSLLSWLLLDHWATPELEASLQTALRSVSPAVLRFRASASLRANALRLAAVSVPVLYLRATDDRLISRSVGDELVSALPALTCMDIQGPHLLLQTAPQACAEAISSFLESLE